MKIRKIDIGEIEGFRIGNAENTEAGTGVTVIIAEEGAVGGVDVRGGGPATRETDLLRSENTVEAVNAVVLSGGSAFGLEAASGVMRALASRNVGFSVGDISVPIVCGASLFDLSVGRSDVFPDREMGIEAVDNAYSGEFRTGNHGAGIGATVGKMMGMERAMKSGLGTYACGDDVVKVGAIAAVNACADVYNGAGNIIAGLRSADGRSIQGTIRVLKGMIHPESDPDLRLEDIREMAQIEKSRSELAAADTRNEIARAIEEAYEHSDAAPEPDPSPVSEDPEAPVTDSAVVAANDAIDIASEDRIDEIADIYLDDSKFEQTEPSQTEASDHAADADVTVSDRAASEQISQEAVTEAESETLSSDQPDLPDLPEYDLPEEEMADMGYDIPFNTTISCVITNARLTKSQANKLASILHDAYARAIKPVHSTLDGDTVFVLSTCTQEVNFDAFAALATDVLQYAIIDGVMSCEGAYGLPAARDIIHK